MKIKLILEYDGSAFSGWQKQASISNIRTVQGSLDYALSIFIEAECKKQNITFKEIITQGASRTDAGVHAEHQVVSFSWPESLEVELKRLVSALNALTPKELAIVSAEVVPDNFDARFSPHKKQYQYNIFLGSYLSPLYNNRVWPVFMPLNIKEMISAAKYFMGTHDFSAFRASDCNAKSTIRTIEESELVRSSDKILVYSISGNGFLKQMVRIIVGTLVEIGHGKQNAEYVIDLLNNKNRQEAGRTAPACGLYLKDIKYTDSWYYEK